MKRVLFLLLACSLLAPEFFAEDNAPVTAEQSGIQRGDQWSYNLTDDVTGDLKATYTYVVSDIDDKVIVTRVNKIGLDGAPGSATFDTHWNLIDDNLWKRKPHDGTGINGPLKAGSEWRLDIDGPELESGDGSAQYEKVEGYRRGRGNNSSWHFLDIQNCYRSAASQYCRSIETLNLNHNSVVCACSESMGKAIRPNKNWRAHHRSVNSRACRLFKKAVDLIRGAR